jgi:hypothetical protein
LQCSFDGGEGVLIFCLRQDTGQKSRGHPEKRARLDSLPTSWDDTYIFQELQASCESQYLETPRMLAKAMLLMEDQLNDRKVELVRDDDLGMVMRATESRILPFDFELATQEIWKTTPDLVKAKGTGIRVRCYGFSTGYRVDEH